MLPRWLKKQLQPILTEAVVIKIGTQETTDPRDQEQIGLVLSLIKKL